MAVASSSSKPLPVKKEPKVVVTTTIVAGNAKSDSSFFSTKPKPKLPSFRKTAAPPVKKEDGTPDPTVAQPSSFDPFQDALKALGKGRGNGGASSGVDTLMATDEAKLRNKKKKSVRFAVGPELEKVRLIEKAIYDDDIEDVSCVTLQTQHLLTTRSKYRASNDTLCEI